MKLSQKNSYRKICVATCVSAAILFLVISVSTAQSPSRKKQSPSQIKSVFTSIPSKVAGAQGIAVQIDLPRAPRYGKIGAPVAIYVPGGFKAAGIEDKTAKLVKEGFIEIRFNFQGSGTGARKSGGIYDYRGPNSLMALRDVIRFALGLMNDKMGKNISELIPFRPSVSNVGLIGWSYGGVTNICVAGVYGDQIKNLAWILNWESPVGDGMPTAEAGAIESYIRPINPRNNRAYNTATGTWDLTSLAYDDSITIRVVDTKDEVTGGFYFDFNGNGNVDYDSDFIPYPLVFKLDGRYKAFYSERVRQEAVANSPSSAGPPPHIINLAETRSFWEKRNGEYWIEEAVQKIPQLKFLVISSEIDHVQTAPDHPHVLLQYEEFRQAGAKFVRLNPDRSYVEHIMKQPMPKAVDNAAFVSFNHQTIRNAVEPGDLKSVLGKALVPAAACELADRTRFNNVQPQLSKVLGKR